MIKVICATINPTALHHLCFTWGIKMYIPQVKHSHKQLLCSYGDPRRNTPGKVHVCIGGTGLYFPC